MIKRLGDKPIDVRECNFPRRAGETLSNHTILLTEQVVRLYKYRRDSIVLAVNPGGVHPFVTWHRMVTSDTLLGAGTESYGLVDSFSGGDYHLELSDAVEAYDKRWQEQSAKLDVEDGDDHENL